MKRIDGDSDVHLDITGLAYEPIVGVEQPEAPAPVAAATETSDGVTASRAAFSGASSAEGIAIGEPAGDVLGRPISVGDTIKIDDVGGDGFDSDITWIDDTLIGTGWYDGGSYDGGSYDGGSYDGGSYDGGSYDYSYSGQWTSAIGDINGDGIQDSLVATYSWDEAGTYSASSYVVYGGGEQTVQLTEGGRSVYGWQVSAAGDVNGDGCDDLLVHTYDYSSGAARAYVVFGGGSASTLDLADLDGSNGFQLPDGSDGTYSYASAAGDVDGDGFADLQVGVYDYKSGTYANYVVYGSGSIAEVQAQLAAILGDYPLGSS
jgi:hypothetical protein